MEYPLPHTPQNEDVYAKKSKMTSRESILLILLFLLILGAVGLYSARIFIQQNQESEQVNLPQYLPDNKETVTSNNNFAQDPESFLVAQENMKQFKDADTVRAFLEKNMNEGYIARSYGSTGMNLLMDSSESMGMSAPMAQKVANGYGGGVSSEYSPTNIQVQGVDEADIVKTDGSYIYTLSRGKGLISVVQADQGDKHLELLASIPVDGTPQDLFVDNNRLIVFGTDTNFYTQPLYKTFIRGGSYTFVDVYDITQKSKPLLVRNLKFEGNYVDARLIGDNVYFVVNSYGFTYFEDEPLLPRVLDQDKVLPQDISSLYYFDIPYDNFNVTTVAGFNILDTNSTVNREHFLLDGTENIYVSPTYLYLAHTKYLDQQIILFAAKKEFLYDRLPQRDKQYIQEIEGISSHILSYREKLQKIERIYDRYILTLSEDESKVLDKRVNGYVEDFYKTHINEIEQTVIQRIALDNSSLRYDGSGKVPGYILNQFSMDEYNGYFRIATTQGRNIPWFLQNSTDFKDIKVSNNLYILDNNLSIAGMVEHIAPGEQIYSTRFMQDRVYMVTFKQVDPFFVIDTSNPVEPKILGKLKLPGYSEYLHPYNKDYIIGFGRDTTTDKDGIVRQEGLKLSLFDVRDVTQPREVHSEVLGGRGSSSVALADHKAFLFSKDKNLLVVPVTLREVSPDGIWGDISFQGAVVYNVNEQGFKLRGKINHEKAQKITESENTGVNFAPGEPYYWIDRSIQRSLYIGDILYTIADDGIQSNSIDNLSFRSYVQLFDVNTPDKRPTPIPLGQPEILDRVVY